MLTGAARFTGSVLLGGTIAPGSSPGTMRTGSETWLGGGTYVWEINDFTGTAGRSAGGWDLLSISGALTLAATSADPFTIALTTLASGNVAGLAANFDPTLNYSFTIGSTTDGIFGFAANAFSLDLSHFANPVDGGIWSIAQNGNNLDLVFMNASAIPEPSTYAALFGVSALGIAMWRRRHGANVRA